MNIFEYTIEIDGITHCGYCGSVIDNGCNCNEAVQYIQYMNEAKYILQHIPKLKYSKREKLVHGSVV